MPPAPQVRCEACCGRITNRQLDQESHGLEVAGKASAACSGGVICDWSELTPATQLDARSGRQRGTIHRGVLADGQARPPQDQSRRAGRESDADAFEGFAHLRSSSKCASGFPAARAKSASASPARATAPRAGAPARISMPDPMLPARLLRRSARWHGQQPAHRASHQRLDMRRQIDAVVIRIHRLE